MTQSINQTKIILGDYCLYNLKADYIPANKLKMLKDALSSDECAKLFNGMFSSFSTKSKKIYFIDGVVGLIISHIAAQKHARKKADVISDINDAIALSKRLSRLIKSKYYLNVYNNNNNSDLLIKFDELIFPNFPEDRIDGFVNKRSFSEVLEAYAETLNVRSNNLAPILISPNGALAKLGSDISKFTFSIIKKSKHQFSADIINLCLPQDNGEILTQGAIKQVRQNRYSKK